MAFQQCRIYLSSIFLPGNLKLIQPDALQRGKDRERRGSRRLILTLTNEDK